MDKHFAILVDADNIGSKYIKTIIDEISENHGIITYKRIYGDWTKPNLAGWKDILLKYSFTPMQQYAYTTGKNATDSAMIIDAMDILYAGKVEGFCLASSDSDFTRLAARLREAGMEVVGMGKQQTPSAFKNACTYFKYVDAIGQDEAEQPEQDAKAKAKKVSAKASDSPHITTTKELKIYINKIIDEKSDESGQLPMSDIGNMLIKKFNDFDVRNYGYHKLSEFLSSLGFNINKYKDENNLQNPSAQIVYIAKKN